MKFKLFIIGLCCLLFSLQPYAQSQSQLVTGVQYYFDTDPGLGVAGNGAILNITPTNNYQQTLQINVPASLGGGVHYLYIRVRDEFGKWSIAERSLLLVEAIHSTQNLVAYQYYFDTDPGQGNNGNGQVVNITPTTNFSQNINLNVPSNISNGLHYVYIRFKDENGMWGVSERKMVLIQPETVSSTVSAYQYYFDTDPGVGIAGNGAIVDVTPVSNFNQIVPINIPNSVTSGVHNLYIRARDNYGRWSITEKRVLLVGSGNTVQSVTAMEYYFDNDPGVGNANPYPVTPGMDLNFTANIDIPCLGSGNHYLYFRAKGENGAWSIVARDTIQITSGVPTATVYPLGNVTICSNDSIKLHASPIAGISYNWLLNGVPILGATDTMYYATTPGNYSLQSTCGSSFTTSNVVTVSITAASTYYQDSDNDGYGNSAISIQGCTQPIGYVFNALDCDDNNGAIHPLAAEICNGVDDNCNGTIDEGVQTIWYADTDGDLYGNTLDTLMSCSQPIGYVGTSGDCDDNNVAAHPNATEICNGIDDNCDGNVDEGVTNKYFADGDGDGYGDINLFQMACAPPSGYVSDSTDCNDNNNAIHAPVLYYVDNDQDGYGSTATAYVCSVTPTTGYSTTSDDCNDLNASINPGAPEVCNGIDDDCDGLTDMDDPNITGMATWYADVDGDGFGNPNSSINSCNTVVGYVANNQDCNDNDALQFPGQIWLMDNDDDGYGTGATQTSCTRPLHGYLLNELTSATGDCNDFDATINLGAQYFTYTGNNTFANSLVTPTNGDSYTNFSFEVMYFDLNGALPPATFPRIILDFEGNGIYTNTNDRVVIMTQDDVNDLNTADGKKYIGTINSLPIGTSWQTLVQTNIGNCASSFGPFNYPDVLIQPDIEIFANDITFSANNPPVSSPLTIQATIHNVSDFAAQNFQVHLVNQYDTTIVYPDITIANLGAQTSTTVSWNITTPAVPAWCPMLVSIDHANVVVESNELDNTAIRPFINGDYNLPGGIITNEQVSPSVAFVASGASNTLYGTAYYTGTAVPLPDSSVAGATVTFTIVETGASFSGYTNSGGYYAISFPRPLVPGIYHITGEITDFTLTETIDASFEVVLPPVAPCLADLSASMQFSSSSITEGNSISGNLYISNTGCAATPATTINVGQNGGSPALPVSIAVPALASGASFTYPLNLFFANAGLYNLCIQVDGQNLIEEVNENNNAACGQVQVVPNTTDIVPGYGPSGTIYQCQTSAIGFRVYNNGGLATGAFGCEVEVYLNNQYQYTLNHTVSNINSNLSGYNWVDFSFPFTPTSTGSYSFILKCDSPVDQVVESNETNNSASFYLNIIPCLPNFNVSGCESFDVESADGNYTPGSNITLQGVISNTGNQAYSGNVLVHWILSGGAIYPETYLVNLSPNASVNVSTVINMPSLANQTLTMMVDPLNTVVEQSEYDNAITETMCWDLSPQPFCYSNFWNTTYLVNQSMYPSIGVHNAHLFNADTVKVKFEVSGPGLPGTINLGYGTINNIGQTCGCPSGVSLPVSFAFPQEGSYVFTMTIDPDNDYDECNEGNNVIVRTVQVTNLPDMRILSQFINPSMLNPQPGQPITMNVTYENIGTSNVNDQMKLKVLVDNQLFSTVYPVNGLANGDNTTISIPGSFVSNLPGIHIIRAIIDADGQILESNESNNEATRSFIVGETANLYFQSFATSNAVPSVNDNIQFNYRVGNNGDLPCEADVHFFYVNNNLDTVFIGGTHVNLAANDSINLVQPWMVTDHKTLIIARIINSSILEATYTDNEASLVLGAMQASITSTNGCVGGNNGTLAVTTLGGDPPYSYNWNNGFIGSVLTAGAGSYTVTVTDQSGQTITATGSIAENLIQVTITEQACDAYLWPANNTTYTNSGSYTHTLVNGNGCDSVVTLQLTILNSSADTVVISTCDAYTWNLSGLTYTSSGIYTFTSVNNNGCTHTHHLHLTIVPASNTSTIVSACGSYTWSVNGTLYTSSGTYTHTGVNGSGCTIVDTLHLNITNGTPNITNITACGSYTWPVNGNTYNLSGTYTDGSGCNLETLNLTIHALPIVTAPPVSGCVGGSLVLGGTPTGGTWNLPNPYSGSALTYTYFYADVNGCTNSAQGIISSTQAYINNVTVPNNTITGISAVVNWNQINGIGWYEIRYKATTASAWNPSVTNNFATSKVITGLQPNTCYEVQVRGFCSTTTPGNWSASTPFCTNNTCQIPTGLSATTTNTSATMNWLAVSGATYYTIRYKLVASSSWIIVTTNTPAVTKTVNLANGNYEFQVRAHCGTTTVTAYSPSAYFTKMSDNRELNLEPTMSTVKEFDLYPNPANDLVYVDYQTEEIGELVIKLSDMSGRVVKEILQPVEKGMNHFSMPLDNLQVGIYSVQLTRDDKIIHVARLIKNE